MFSSCSIIFCIWLKFNSGSVLIRLPKMRGRVSFKQISFFVRANRQRLGQSWKTWKCESYFFTLIKVDKHIHGVGANYSPHPNTLMISDYVLLKVAKFPYWNLQKWQCSLWKQVNTLSLLQILNVETLPILEGFKQETLSLFDGHNLN